MAKSFSFRRALISAARCGCRSAKVLETITPMYWRGVGMDSSVIVPPSTVHRSGPLGPRQPARDEIRPARRRPRSITTIADKHCSVKREVMTDCDSERSTLNPVPSPSYEVWEKGTGPRRLHGLPLPASVASERGRGNKGEGET